MEKAAFIVLALILLCMFRNWEEGYNKSHNPDGTAAVVTSSVAVMGLK